MRVPLPVVVVVDCLGLPSVYGVFGSTSSNMHFLKIIKRHIVCRIKPCRRFGEVSCDTAQSV